jgi:predicted secreted protein
MRAIAAVGLGLAFLVTCGCATNRSAGGMLVLEVPAAPGVDAAPKEVRGQMTVGERLEVRLGAFAGTGYAWSLSGPVPAVMQPTGTDPAGAVTPMSTDGRVGGATMTTFGMTAVGQGEAHMRFELARPWERTPDGAKAARTVEVIVDVRPAPAASEPDAK